MTKSAVIWHETKGASYVPSPVAQGGLFFVVSDGGLASCFEPKTGQRYWMERLGKHHTARQARHTGADNCDSLCHITMV